MKSLQHLASLKLTTFLILWLIIGVVLNIQFEHHWALIAPPLFAVCLNLIAALIVTRRLRQDPWLLIFHLALLALVFLAGLNQLTSRKGHIEIFEGGEFTGQLDEQDTGPLLLATLDDLRFTLVAVEVAYNDEGERIGTFSRIQVTQPVQDRQSFVVADQHPFKYRGYRFYTTHNKGFALIMRWYDYQTGESSMGAIHLPGYPVNQFDQSIRWQPPEGQPELWLHLDFDPVVPGEATGGQFRLPESPELVIRFDEERLVMNQGETRRLETGELTFMGVRAWMGFKVQYDGLIKWLLASAIMAILSLAAYLVRRRQLEEKNTFSD